jgi:hypothetical protein
MTETEVLSYVKASACAQGLTLDDARAHRAATHWVRLAHLAQLLDAAPLDPDLELAEIFKPLAFPPSSNNRDTL